MGRERAGKDVSRQERKQKRRAAEDAIPDVPGDVPVNDDEAPVLKKRKVQENGEDGKDAKKAKKVKRSDDEKKPEKIEQGKRESRREEGVENDGGVALDQEVDGVEEAPRKSKKERKAERKAAEAAEAAQLTSGEQLDARETKVAAAVSTDSRSGDKKKKKKEKKPKIEGNPNKTKRKDDVDPVADDETNGTTEGKTQKEKSAGRYIVFVGNLPYTATTASLQNHFKSVTPSAIRHLTQKDDPAKSKGCAFVEFANNRDMEKCLKNLHHSNFDDGLSAARKINVELTAGGGGNKSSSRRKKISEKNDKINEERLKRVHELEKAKVGKQAARDKEKEGGSASAGGIDQTAIHPSRRTRVPDAAVAAAS